jgi:diguanylate cyclase (GGDEF) domain
MAARFRRYATAWVAVAVLACSAGQARASQPIADVTTFLDQAYAIRLTDNARFTAMLAQLHEENPPMTAGQRWRLRYMEAAQAQMVGHYAEAAKELRAVIDHSGHPGLVSLAMGKLLDNLSTTHHYEELFILARQAVALVPTLKDTVARHALLVNLSQSMTFAGQPELGLKYAQMVEADLAPGESPCLAMMVEVAARYSLKKLPSGGPELERATAACAADGTPARMNMLSLTKSARLIEEGKPEAGLKLLDSIAPSVEQSHYFSARASLYSARANALLALNRDAEARQAALATVALFHPGDVDNFLKDAYNVLYEVEKREKRDTLALAYFQQYAAQERGAMDDMTARTLAYETVQQQALQQGLESEKLAHQNSVLQLEQSLTARAVETGRLYIALLVILLGSVLFWLIRTKRSQLRFKQLSCQDGLTGVANHQHFMTRLEVELHELERRRAPACLVLLDLDHFKAVNDTYGHAVGDAVLKRATATCRQQLRSVDLFGRLGGEEFGILLPECQAEQGLVVANCIRAAMEATPVTVDGHVVTYSASIGVACTKVSGYGLQRIRREADAALYRAKSTGRNRVMSDFQGSGFVNA